MASTVFPDHLNIANKRRRVARAVSIDGEPTQFWMQVYALPQALTYFVSSLAGAAALFVLLKTIPL
jgi:hypothetical protein